MAQQIADRRDTDFVLWEQMDGQGVPQCISVAASKYFTGANWSVNCYSGTRKIIKQFLNYNSK